MGTTVEKDFFDDPSELRTVQRGCPLCEAMCGLSVTLDDRDRVVSVRGDALDVYSRGYLCPKGASLGAVDDDPDRLTRPLVRRGGELREATWAEAFAEVDRLLTPLLADDRDCVAAYTGNPTGHNVAFTLLAGRLARALGSIQSYSPATMDQLPQNVTAALLFGEPSSIPVPDLDTTDLLVVVGGNPLVSHGSVGAAPDYRRPPDRPARPALQELLAAQRRPTGQGRSPLDPARQPHRRRGPRPPGRRHRAGHLGRGRGPRPGPGDRRGGVRCRVTGARVGPRRPARTPAGGRAEAGGQQQHPDRRHRAGPAVGDGADERDPGPARPGLTAAINSRSVSS